MSKTPNRYSQEAVNKAIEASNRSGRKISRREARLIHGILQGRHPQITPALAELVFEGVGIPKEIR